jgi:hypothetical protein
MSEVKTIWGIFQANGGLIGEVSYMVGKLTGKSHCSLCDITHGRWSEKSEMVDCRESSEAPFLLVHLNEQSDALAAFTAKKTPCVVAELTNGEFVMLLDSEKLESCVGEFSSFEAAFNAAKSELASG